MRNHGESPWDDDVTYAAMASDLASVIEKCCDNKAVVLGHSMGGKAAMALALTRSELLAGVIVADIAPVAFRYVPFLLYTQSKFFVLYISVCYTFKYI